MSDPASASIALGLKEVALGLFGVLASVLGFQFTRARKDIDELKKESVRREEFNGTVARIENELRDTTTRVDGFAKDVRDDIQELNRTVIMLASQRGPPDG